MPVPTNKPTQEQNFEQSLTPTQEQNVTHEHTCVGQATMCPTRLLSFLHWCPHSVIYCILITRG
ncbi:hypothetical protein SK128_006678 [Halocaridina rubra]|uniref:Uncharacterized protein n=1 Tax=Halocaridina rubra TaxID=373956 RepID=A0AAN8ZZ48_HALRR